MSGARVVRVALVALGLAGAVAFAPPPARQADVIVVRVGGDLSARNGQPIDVPVTVDMTGAPGRTLGSYRLRLVYDPSVLSYNDIVRPSGFAEPLVNTDSSGYGVVKFTALRPSGAGGVISLFVARFYVARDSAPSAVTLDVQELTQADATFTDLLPMAQIVNGTFCRSLGTWGDVDGDGSSNSRDALVALSVVVGLPVDTTLVNPALADVDADGAITSRDALIILSSAVGLPVTGFRIGLTAAGACATGSATTLVILPDSLELQRGQRASVLVQARDVTGRVVPTGSVSWSSSNSSVAAFVDDNNGIDARDPGVATLTAQLGPGLRATMKVVVLARRRNWYVDVTRALNVPTQAGSQAFPFAFIGDAMNVATDGDTVHVAAGEYDERVSASVSVILLGDSLSRPVVDQRGSQDYSQGDQTIYAGSPAARMEIAHLVVRGGGIYVEGHDNTVRDVRIEMLGGTSQALEVYSQASVPGAPPAGLSAVSALVDLGQVLVDGVVVEGYASRGIDIDQADTATVRNSSVTRDVVSTNECSVYYPGDAGIMVQSANSSVIRNNVVTNATCAGIGAFQQSGRVVISRNRVTRASTAGITASAPVVALDHNVMRSIALGGDPYSSSYGAYVSNYNGVDTVLSTGDSVVGIRNNYAVAGLRIDTAVVAIVDSLVADSIGLDATYNGNGLSFQGRRLTVTNSRISAAQQNGIEAQGQQLVFTSRGNRIRSVLGEGITVSFSCECSGSGPDSIFSTKDTVIGADGNLINLQDGLYARVDTAFVDSSSGGNGVNLANLTRAVVRDSRILHNSTGIYAQSMTSLDLRGNTVTGSTYAGVYITYPSSAADSATIVGNTIDSSGSAALWLTQTAAAIVDSNRLTNSAFDGLYFDFDGGARVTRTRIENNLRYGVAMINYVSAPSLANNIIAGNVQGGAANFSDAAFAMDADSNYWGDPAGPRCNVAVTGVPCDTLSLGDSVLTDHVAFIPFLTSEPPAPAEALRASLRIASGVRAARFWTAASRTAAPPRPAERPRMATRAARPAGLTRASTVAAARQPAQRRPFPNAAQKGRQPRAPRPARAPHRP